MARLLTPRGLRRGLEIFVLASLLGFGAVLFSSNNAGAFLAAIPHLKWPWLLVGLALASLDWLGGGLRLWGLARPDSPATPFLGPGLAGGVGGRAQSLGPGAADPPGPAVPRAGARGGDGGVGVVPHAAPVGQRADDDLHDAALRDPGPPGDHARAHVLHPHGRLLRDRGADRHRVRGGALARHPRGGAGDLALRPLPREPEPVRAALRGPDPGGDPAPGAARRAPRRDPVRGAAEPADRAAEH